MSKFEDVLTEWQSDVETIAHLDFEPEMVCGVRRPTPCSTPADFIMSCRHCSWSMLVCGPHRAAIQHQAQVATGVLCGRCRTVSADLAAGVEFIPIKAGS